MAAVDDQFLVIRTSPFSLKVLCLLQGHKLISPAATVDDAVRVLADSPRLLQIGGNAMNLREAAKLFHRQIIEGLPAEEVPKEVKSPHDPGSYFGTVAKALVQGASQMLEKRLPVIAAFQERIAEVRCQENRRDRFVAYRQIALDFARAGWVEEAVGMIEEMFEWELEYQKNNGGSLRPTFVPLMIGFSCDQGSLGSTEIHKDIALALLQPLIDGIRKFENPYSRAHALIALILPLRQIGHLEKSMAIREEALFYAREVEDKRSRCFALLEIAEYQLGDLDEIFSRSIIEEVFAILEEGVENERARFEVLDTISHQISGYNPELGREFLPRFLRAAEVLKGHDKQCRLLLDTANNFFHGNDRLVLLALPILEKAWKTWIESTESYGMSLRTVAYLVVTLFRFFQSERANQALDRFIDSVGEGDDFEDDQRHYLLIDRWTLLATEAASLEPTLADAFFQNAFEVIPSFESPPWRLTASVLFARRLGEAGRTERAANLLKEVLRFIGDVGDQDELRRASTLIVETIIIDMHLLEQEVPSYAQDRRKVQKLLKVWDKKEPLFLALAAVLFSMKMFDLGEERVSLSESLKSAAQGIQDEKSRQEFWKLVDE